VAIKDFKPGLLDRLIGGPLPRQDAKKASEKHNAKKAVPEQTERKPTPLYGKDVTVSVDE
jgi:hypothetical protein